jgi:alpha-L-rhamnosidase
MPPDAFPAKPSIMRLKNNTLLLCSGLLVLGLTTANAQDAKPAAWPEKTVTAKPWTRWWWMGNAVDKEGIRDNLTQLSQAGIGGVEIAPIYGVKGEEVNFIDFLSPKWVEMLSYTIHTADSLGMKVDMTLGTGWPYGGPQVTVKDAATKLVVQKYPVIKGEQVDMKIVIDTLKEKKPAELTYVLAYAEDGKYEDLTAKLKDGVLKWKAKGQNYTLYAVFTGKTGQVVKRSAPGGQGFTVDHYSTEALHNYLKPFEAAFEKLESKPRAVFNDSYEVYGTTFTPKLFDEFKKRRGYDLKPHLPKLLDTISTDAGDRIKADYRETISDLLLGFDTEWTNWAHQHGLKTKLQAHGSPGNLLDYYAAADIPECETFGSMPFDIPGLRRTPDEIIPGDADPVMLRFSASAGHVMGRPLVSSETFTWLREHFKATLSDGKPEAEELLLSGINHIFLHGSVYSPKRAKWPGWDFYASVNFNYNNTIWQDAPALFSYLNNCQLMLQQGSPDNETLLYWPVYDIWQQTLKADLLVEFGIKPIDRWLKNTSFYTVSKALLAKGYGVDFISDAIISKATVVDGKIILPGGSYKSLVVPDCKYMPLATLKALIALKDKGANIIFTGLPQDTPGFKDHEAQLKEMKALLAKNNIHGVADIFDAQNQAGVYAESLTSTGLKYNRRKLANGDKMYFIVNHSGIPVSQYIPLNVSAEEVVISDPLTGKIGKAEIKSEGGRTIVRVSIQPGESLFLTSGKKSETADWKYYRHTGDYSYPLDLKWNISFLKGGPALPKDNTITSLNSWTMLGSDAEAFSGTAAYEGTFDKPANADVWTLDLGDVRESAKVWINGNYVGCAWANPFRLQVENLKDKGNTIRIEVTNLPANRLRNLEQKGEEWKIFYEINMVNKDYLKFDAKKWQPMPSGLLGPIKLIPLKEAAVETTVNTFK